MRVIDRLAERGSMWSGCFGILRTMIAFSALFGFGGYFYNDLWLKKDLTYIVLPSYDTGTQVFGGLVIENRGRAPLTDVQIILASLATPIQDLNMPGPHEPVEIVDGGVGETTLALRMPRLSRGTALSIYMVVSDPVAFDQSSLLVTANETVGRAASAEVPATPWTVFALWVIVGFVASGLLGFTLSRLRMAWARAGSYGRPRLVSTTTAAVGKVEEAIRYYESTLAIAQENGDRRNEGFWLGNLGSAYHNLGKVEEAISYYEDALAIAQEIGDRCAERIQLSNLGSAYRALGKVEEAIGYHERALTISQQIGDRPGEGAVLGNLGSAYHNLGKVEEAIGYHKSALAIAQEIGDRHGEGYNSWYLGLLYEETDPARAVELMSVCVQYEREIGHPDAEADAERVTDIQAKLTGGVQ